MLNMKCAHALLQDTSVKYKQKEKNKEKKEQYPSFFGMRKGISTIA